MLRRIKLIFKRLKRRRAIRKEAEGKATLQAIKDCRDRRKAKIKADLPIEISPGEYIQTNKTVEELREIEKIRKKRELTYMLKDLDIQHIPDSVILTTPTLNTTILKLEPKLFNIEIQLSTDPISGDPIQYTYKNVPHYTLRADSIMMELKGKTISSKYDIVHITEIE